MFVTMCKRLVWLAAAAAAVAAPTRALGQEIDIPDTQIQYNRGMHVAPLFEGWTRNPNGTIDMWFGYLNRNWDEVLHVPVGLDNRVEPGGPDGGQPTVFVPRRREGRAVQRRETMVFAVNVPSDWDGDKEVVWTVTANGKTDRAIGLYLPIYELRPRDTNQAPTLDVSIESDSVALPDTVSVLASVSDDGQPHRRRGSANVRWVHYRGVGSVTFSPGRASFPEGTDPIDDLEVATTVTFSQPGTFMLRAVAYDGDWYGTQNVTVRVSDGSAGH